MQKIVVVGTSTEVGKTWVTAHLIRQVKILGANVAARKVVQSYDERDPVEQHDRSILAAASGEDPLIVCPDAKSFGMAMAPPVAALLLGREPPTLEELLDMWPCQPQCDVVFIETAGGLRSPQGRDADALDVASWLDPDLVVLVAPDELGVISDVRLCHDALLSRLLDVPIVVVLNQLPATQSTGSNGAWLREEDGFDVRDAVHGLDELAEQLVRSLT